MAFSWVLLPLVLAICIVCHADVDCNFDSEMCGWMQDNGGWDELDFTRHRGPTPTPGTGPTADHTTGAGYYMYLESSTGTNGQRARLNSRVINTRDYLPGCFTFWYHMSGFNVGALRVYVSTIYTYPTGGGAVKIWERDGNQGAQWIQGKVYLQPGGNAERFQLVLEAQKGVQSSDIAIDDVSLSNIPCPPETTTTITTTTNMTTPIITPEPTTAPMSPSTSEAVSQSTTSTAAISTTTEHCSPTGCAVDFITVADVEYVRLPNPCNIIDNLCPLQCMWQIRKLDSASHCFHCACTGNTGTLVVG